VKRKAEVFILFSAAEETPLSNEKEENSGLLEGSIQFSCCAAPAGYISEQTHRGETFPAAYSLEMRSRHPAKTSLFRLSSLWLLWRFVLTSG
jgi:hypothetical protein